MKNIIQLFKHFDFTESETKVYITLLQHGASTGYEVSKHSSVSRSKVYNLLETLLDKGCIIVSKQTNPLRYSAVPIDELIANIKATAIDTLAEISSELKSYQQTMDLEKLWYIHGYKNIFNKCNHLLRKAEKSVYVQVWKEDVDLVLTELKQVEKHLDQVVIILYSTTGDYQLDLKHYYRHGFEAEKLIESGGRWINLVIDGNEVIFGHIQNEKNAEVIWTQSKPMVFLAQENISHDAYCLRLIATLDDKAKDHFGPELKGIRNIFNSALDNVQ